MWTGLKTGLGRILGGQKLPGLLLDASFIFSLVCGVGGVGVGLGRIVDIGFSQKVLNSE